MNKHTYFLLVPGIVNQGIVYVVNSFSDKCLINITTLKPCVQLHVDATPRHTILDYQHQSL